jgi:putative oxidoreductase
MRDKILGNDRSSATVLIRIMVGAIFISEGFQKWIFPQIMGAGRFQGIGLPYPAVLAYLVGAFEVGCGFMVLAGFLTRVAAVPLVIIMLAAVYTTKIPILLTEGPWAMAHASRTDYAMLLGSLFLLLKGSGRWSIDNLILDRHAGNPVLYPRGAEIPAKERNRLHH